MLANLEHVKASLGRQESDWKAATAGLEKTITAGQQQLSSEIERVSSDCATQAAAHKSHVETIDATIKALREDTQASAKEFAAQTGAKLEEQRGALEKLSTEIQRAATDSKALGERLTRSASDASAAAEQRMNSLRTQLESKIAAVEDGLKSKNAAQGALVEKLTRKTEQLSDKDLAQDRELDSRIRALKEEHGLRIGDVESSLRTEVTRRDKDAKEAAVAATKRAAEMDAAIKAAQKETDARLFALTVCLFTNCRLSFCCHLNSNVNEHSLWWVRPWLRRASWSDRARASRTQMKNSQS